MALHAGDSCYCLRQSAGLCAAKMKTGEINRILQAPEMREMLSSQGADPLGISPEEFAAVIAADLVKCAKVVASAGIKAGR